MLIQGWSGHQPEHGRRSYLPKSGYLPARGGAIFGSEQAHLGRPIIPARIALWCRRLWRRPEILGTREPADEIEAAKRGPCRG